MGRKRSALRLSSIDNDGGRDFAPFNSRQPVALPRQCVMLHLLLTKFAQSQKAFGAVAFEALFCLFPIQNPV